MTAEGTFVLYSRIDPPLKAGDYRFDATSELEADGPHGALPATDLRVAPLATHVRVRSPRFSLPPDQVLSTFPPADREGAFGMRLPQVVLKRRTLPWERALAGADPSVPWLALVLIAEGEAELMLNRPVVECVTAGVALDGPADTEVGNCLSVRKSVIDRVFPTRLDVALLAHAREVDIGDTELMMGDDDGFLAVVISNRLPLHSVDAAGEVVPVRYLACLVNLEGQFSALRERAPVPVVVTRRPELAVLAAMNVAEWDHLSMRTATSGAAADSATATFSGETKSAHTVAGWSSVAAKGSSTPDVPISMRTGADVARDMAAPFVRVRDVGPAVMIDPTYRFPVLLHWSFTSVGQTTFETLMRKVDSGLLGTEGETARPPVEGRLPLEVVETGHVGLVNRTRAGDEVRAWYRGPFVGHPTVDPPGGRLALAHASDQLRIVIPDGREDLSLASAFEIGRLLALARPAVVASLLRWRQTQFQTARLRAIWASNTEFLTALGLDVAMEVDAQLGVTLGRRLTSAIAEFPATVLAEPSPLVRSGRPLELGGSARDVLTRGMALAPDLFDGALSTVVQRLLDTTAVVESDRTPVASEILRQRLEEHVAVLVEDTLHLRENPIPRRIRVSPVSPFDPMNPGPSGDNR